MVNDRITEIRYKLDTGPPPPNVQDVRYLLSVIDNLRGQLLLSSKALKGVINERTVAEEKIRGLELTLTTLEDINDEENRG